MTTEAAEDAPQQPPDEALQDALRALLVPIARLAVERGLPFATAEAILKQAFVDNAADAHPGLLAHRKVSRISTVTGINRREVTRLTRTRTAAVPRRRSVAAEVYARWLTDPAFRGTGAGPLVLPRQGGAPSFEALAQAVTRDVHPRSLLDELIRLKLATLDEGADQVTLAADATPRGDGTRMLGFLADNVGDHLKAAVGNVLGSGSRHFEQALFADGMSDDTMAWVREAVIGRWRDLLATMVPELEKRLADDGRITPPPNRRWRLGLYSYDESAAPADGQTPAASAPRKRTKKATP